MDNIFAIFAVIFIPILLIFIALYVINAISLSTLAKNNRYEDKAILAWIPIANSYLYGLLGGDVEIAGSAISENVMGIVMVVASLGSIGIEHNFIIMLVIQIIFAFGTYNLVKRINKDIALLIAVINYFIPLVAIIYIFVKKDTIFGDAYEYYYEDEQDDYNMNKQSSEQSYTNKQEQIDTVKYDDNYNEIK